MNVTDKTELRSTFFMTTHLKQLRISHKIEIYSSITIATLVRQRWQRRNNAFVHLNNEIGSTPWRTELVEALRYKPESRGFDSRWSAWNFTLT